MCKYISDLFQCMLDNGITEADLKNTESTSCYGNDFFSIVLFTSKQLELS